MSPAALRAIRDHLGLTQTEMGRALGYSGPNTRQTVHRYETGEREAPPWIIRLAEMYRRHGIPTEWR